MTGFGGSRSIQDTRVYAQETAPTDTRDGILWIDTSDPRRPTYVYSGDSGNWEAVAPPTPIASTQEAAFGSDLTAANNVEARNGGVRLQDAATVQSSQSFTASGAYTNSGDWYGVVISPKLGIKEATVTWSSPNPDASTLVLEGPNGRIAETSVSSTSDGSTTSLSWSTPLSPGENYAIAAQANNGSQQFDYDDAISFPTDAGDVFTVEDGVYNGSDPLDSSWGRVGAFSSIQLDAMPNNGTGRVEIGADSPMTAWDTAAVRAALENESVTVDIQDGNGNVVLSDVEGNNIDISVLDPSDDVVFAVDISRTDPLNDPGLVYAARRFHR